MDGSEKAKKKLLKSCNNSRAEPRRLDLVPHVLPTPASDLHGRPPPPQGLECLTPLTPMWGLVTPMKMEPLLFKYGDLGLTNTKTQLM